VSEEVAYDMASASYIRASEVKVEEKLEGDPVGVGITASVASTKLPRGSHRAHLVLITKNTVNHLEIKLEKGVGEELRLQHDKIISYKTLDLICGVLSGAIASDPESEEKALARFYKYPIFHTNGTRRKPEDRERAVYLPATLNPIHEGHRAMCRAVEEALSPTKGPGRIKATYLVSAVSPHKGRLSVQDMLFKAGMLRAERWRKESRMVEFSLDEPLFIDKARKRPGSVFVIGADTMQRMLDPKWGVPIEPMLNEMRNLGVEFHVMGRNIDGKWITCRDVTVPWPMQILFYPLEGRVDLSSTELREAK
jgi:nicotinic acid mononucleotide adenylyltransferase